MMPPHHRSHQLQQQQQQPQLRRQRRRRVVATDWSCSTVLVAVAATVAIMATTTTTRTHAFSVISKSVYTFSSSSLLARNAPPTGNGGADAGAAATSFAPPGMGMPDLPALFDKIRQVSPLARQVMTSGNDVLQTGLQGLALVEDHLDKALQWKTVERQPTNTVHQIDKLESFDGKSAPLFRFRASLEGPLVDGGVFGQYILDLDQRKKWDDKIEQVKQVHHLDALQDIFNLDLGSSRLSLQKSASATNDADLGDVDLGECVRLGVGYGQTKKALGITEREQLFWFGMQEFGGCGAYILWGQEVDDDDDKSSNKDNAKQSAGLWPEGSPRYTRAKSHLFSATLIPTSDTTFDVEYVLQMEIGGQIPKFLTTPVLIDTVKNLFKVASEELSSGIESLWKQKRQDEVLEGRELLLMTP